MEISQLFRGCDAALTQPDSRPFSQSSEARSGANRQEAEAFALSATDGADEPGPERDAAIDPTVADASARLPDALEGTVSAVGD